MSAIARRNWALMVRERTRDLRFARHIRRLRGSYRTLSADSMRMIYTQMNTSLVKLEGIGPSAGRTGSFEGLAPSSMGQSPEFPPGHKGHYGSRSSGPGAENYRSRGTDCEGRRTESAQGSTDRSRRFAKGNSRVPEVHRPTAHSAGF
jgi:hypothetical protein